MRHIAVAGIILILVARNAPAQEETRLFAEEYTPANAVAFVSIQPAAIRKRIRQCTPLVDFLRSSGAERFVKETSAAMQEAIRAYRAAHPEQADPEKTRESRDALIKLGSILTDSNIAMALLPPRRQEGDAPLSLETLPSVSDMMQYVLWIESDSPQAADLPELLPKALGALDASDVRPLVIDPRGVDINEENVDTLKPRPGEHFFTDSAGAYFFLKQKDNRFAIVLDPFGEMLPDRARACMDPFLEKKPVAGGMAAQDAYKALKARRDAQSDLVFLYSPLPLFDPDRVRPGFGLETIRGLALRVAADATGFHEEISLYWPAPRGRLEPFLTPKIDLDKAARPVAWSRAAYGIVSFPEGPPEEMLRNLATLFEFTCGVPEDEAIDSLAEWEMSCGFEFERFGRLCGGPESVLGMQLGVSPDTLLCLQAFGSHTGESEEIDAFFKRFLEEFASMWGMAMVMGGPADPADQEKIQARMKALAAPVEINSPDGTAKSFGFGLSELLANRQWVLSVLPFGQGEAPLLQPGPTYAAGPEFQTVRGIVGDRKLCAFLATNPRATATVLSACLWWYHLYLAGGGAEMDFGVTLPRLSRPLTFYELAPFATDSLLYAAADPQTVTLGSGGRCALHLALGAYVAAAIDAIAKEAGAEAAPQEKAAENKDGADEQD